MKTRAQKEATVKILAEKLAKAKSVVFADYQGLTMKHISTLRKNIKEQQAEFTVTKNTLLNLSLKEAKLPEISAEVRIGPIATLFSYEDEISPIKVLVKIFKDAQIGKVKAGLLNGLLLDATSIIRLASLPGKTELRSQVVGLLASPLQGMVIVLQGNLKNLVFALDQVRIQKGGE